MKEQINTQDTPVRGPNTQRNQLLSDIMETSTTHLFHHLHITQNHEDINLRFLTGTTKHQHLYLRFPYSGPFSETSVIPDAFHRLAQGGLIMVEEFAHFRFFCLPHSSAVDRFNELLEIFACSQGCTTAVEVSLQTALQDAGFTHFHTRRTPPVFLKAENKQLISHTLQCLAKHLEALKIASDAELKGLISQLQHFEQQIDSMITLPGILQVYATK